MSNVTIKLSCFELGHGVETVGAEYREGMLSDASAESLVDEIRGVTDGLTNQTNGSHVVRVETILDGERAEPACGMGVLTTPEMYAVEGRLAAAMGARLEAQKAK